MAVALRTHQTQEYIQHPEPVTTLNTGIYGSGTQNTLNTGIYMEFRTHFTQKKRLKIRTHEIQEYL